MKISWIWFFCALVVAWSIGYAAGEATAHADIDRVMVNPAVPEASQLSARIERKLAPDDEIAVVVAPGDDHDLLGDYLNNSYKGKVLILAIGDDVWVRGNDWVPQVMLDEKLARVLNVNRALGDRVVGMIAETHSWQSDHPRPTPPPPPPPPPGPPPAPEPPFDWSPYMIYIYIGVPILVLFLIWLPLELRRRRRDRRLSLAADEQADWGFDKYSIKTSTDL